MQISRKGQYNASTDTDHAASSVDSQLGHRYRIIEQPVSFSASLSKSDKTLSRGIRSLLTLPLRIQQHTQHHVFQWPF